MFLLSPLGAFCIWLVNLCPFCAFSLTLFCASSSSSLSCRGVLNPDADDGVSFSCVSFWMFHRHFCCCYCCPMRNRPNRCCPTLCGSPSASFPPAVVCLRFDFENDVFCKQHWTFDDVIGALCGCRAVKFDSCNNLLSSIHTIHVIILRYVRLNINTKYYYHYCYFIVLKVNIYQTLFTRIIQ